MRSRDTLTYGKVESRIRFAKGSGVVSSLVLIYTPWPADDWNELDIEVLGRYSDRLQTNVMVYTGPPTTPPVAQSVTPTPSPQVATLAFDPSADFHDYTIEWTPTEARFTIDGELTTNLVDHDRPAEAAPEHPADDLGVVRGGLGGSDRHDHRADQRRLRLDPRLRLGAGDKLTTNLNRFVFGRVTRCEG